VSLLNEGKAQASNIVTQAVPQPFSLQLASPFFVVAAELTLAILMGLGFVALGVGEGSWILGGIAAGALTFFYRSRSNHSLQPNRNSRKLGQILIGLTVGFSIHARDLTALPAQLPIFGLLTLFLLLSSGAIGYVYSRLQKTDLLTALLAAVPGNIGIMASVAADYGKNTTLVALVQLMRFTTVTLVVPMIAQVANAHDIRAVLASLTQDLAAFNATNLLLLCFVFAVTAIVVYGGDKLHVPVATFFCPIVVGIGFNVQSGLISPLNADFNLPTVLKVIGQILLGMTIGEYWGINPRVEGLAVVCATFSVGLTLLAGLMSAAIAEWLTSWDWLTCLLVTAPGGSPEMIWIALALNHNVEVVTAGHLIRLMAINLLLPALVAGVNLTGSHQEGYATLHEEE
jgi:hypothetical protein